MAPAHPCSLWLGKVLHVLKDVCTDVRLDVRRKCFRADMEHRCRVPGVVFQPMIFESLGGVSSEADRVIRCLNKAVAVNTDSSETEVATMFWQRLSIDLQRSAHRAFARRVRQPGCGDGGYGGEALRLGALLHMPEGL